jgi:hypothetical protein
MNAHVKELMASRRCNADERKVVNIADSGQLGTDLYWCEPIGQWVIINLEPGPQIAIAREIALVRMDEDADPDKGLSQRALACDFEGEQALWIIDVAELDALAPYGNTIEVLWSSNPEDSHYRAAV